MELTNQENSNLLFDIINYSSDIFIEIILYIKPIHLKNVFLICKNINNTMNLERLWITLLNYYFSAYNWRNIKLIPKENDTKCYNKLIFKKLYKIHISNKNNYHNKNNIKVKLENIALTNDDSSYSLLSKYSKNRVQVEFTDNWCNKTDVNEYVLKFYENKKTDEICKELKNTDYPNDKLLLKYFKFICYEDLKLYFDNMENNNKLKLTQNIIIYVVGNIIFKSKNDARSYYFEEPYLSEMKKIVNENTILGMINYIKKYIKKNRIYHFDFERVLFLLITFIKKLKIKVSNDIIKELFSEEININQTNNISSSTLDDIFGYFTDRELHSYFAFSSKNCFDYFIQNQQKYKFQYNNNDIIKIIDIHPLAIKYLNYKELIKQENGIQIFDDICSKAISLSNTDATNFSKIENDLLSIILSFNIILPEKIKIEYTRKCNTFPKKMGHYNIDEKIVLEFLDKDNVNISNVPVEYLKLYESVMLKAVTTNDNLVLSRIANKHIEIPHYIVVKAIMHNFSKLKGLVRGLTNKTIEIDENLFNHIIYTISEKINEDNSPDTPKVYANTKKSRKQYVSDFIKHMMNCEYFDNIYKYPVEFLNILDYINVYDHEKININKLCLEAVCINPSNVKKIHKFLTTIICEEITNKIILPLDSFHYHSSLLNEYTIDTVFDKFEQVQKKLE